MKIRRWLVVATGLAAINFTTTVLAPSTGRSFPELPAVGAGAIAAAAAFIGVWFLAGVVDGLLWIGRQVARAASFKDPR